MEKEEFTYQSSNGMNIIHGTIWMPDEEVFSLPRSIIQISHGMIEFIERYDDMASYFTQKGFLVVGNDHIGHGRSVNSKKEWGYFASNNGSKAVVEDLHTLTNIIKQRYPDVPYFLLGHSMGSFMARRYMMNYGKELDGVILMGTGNQPKFTVILGKAIVDVASAIHGDWYRSKGIDRMMFGSYNRRIKNPKTSSDWISSDEKIVQAYINEPACTYIFTLNGIKTLLNTILYIQKKSNIQNIPRKLPMLIASGREDPVGNYGKDVSKLYNIYKKIGIEDVQLKLYEGCRHEIHNETIKNDIYEEIIQWIMNIVDTIKKNKSE